MIKIIKPTVIILSLLGSYHSFCQNDNIPHEVSSLSYIPQELPYPSSPSSSHYNDRLNENYEYNFDKKVTESEFLPKEEPVDYVKKGLEEINNLKPDYQTSNQSSFVDYSSSSSSSSSSTVQNQPKNDSVDDSKSATQPMLIILVIGGFLTIIYLGFKEKITAWTPEDYQER
ncbi:hypothetical protein PQG46_08535 [Aquirufa nivalisilvae]